MLLNRAHASGLTTLRMETVQINDELSANLRYPTIAQRSAVEKIVSEKRLEEIRGWMLAYTLCDEAGVLLYDATKPEDLAELQAFPADTFGDVADKATKLFGWKGEDKAQIEKNL